MKCPALGCAVLAAIAFAPLGALADSPQHFLHDAIAGDYSEVELGNMAQGHAATPQVRDYGRTLSADHSHARDQAVALARHIGMPANSSMTPEASHERSLLLRAQGRDFDREFVRYMIDDHRKDIAAFRDQANQNRGPVSQFAREQLPVLQKHLDMAMAIQAHQDDRFAQGDHGNDRDRGHHR